MICTSGLSFSFNFSMNWYLMFCEVWVSIRHQLRIPYSTVLVRNVLTLEGLSWINYSGSYNCFLERFCFDCSLPIPQNEENERNCCALSFCAEVSLDIQVANKLLQVVPPVHLHPKSCFMESELFYYFIIIALLCIIVAGSVTNLLVIVLISRNKQVFVTKNIYTLTFKFSILQLWSRQTLLVLSLACADLSMALAGVIPCIVSAVYREWIFGHLGCQMEAFMCSFVGEQIHEIFGIFSKIKQR